MGVGFHILNTSIVEEESLIMCQLPASASHHFCVDSDTICPMSHVVACQ